MAEDEITAVSELLPGAVPVEVMNVEGTDVVGAAELVSPPTKG